jgi:hypothetical protein
MIGEKKECNGSMVVCMFVPSQSSSNNKKN